VEILFVINEVHTSENDDLIYKLKGCREDEQRAPFSAHWKSIDVHMLEILILNANEIQIPSP
jgi:hypothetical protein